MKNECFQTTRILTSLQYVRTRRNNTLMREKRQCLTLPTQSRMTLPHASQTRHDMHRNTCADTTNNLEVPESHRSFEGTLYNLQVRVSIFHGYSKETCYETLTLLYYDQQLAWLLTLRRPESDWILAWDKNLSRGCDIEKMYGTLFLRFLNSFNSYYYRVYHGETNSWDKIIRGSIGYWWSYHWHLTLTCIWNALFASLLMFVSLTHRLMGQQCTIHNFRNNITLNTFLHESSVTRPPRIS